MKTSTGPTDHETKYKMRGLILIVSVGYEIGTFCT